MKKFILLVISILFVFGCTTNKKEISKQTEVIQAFFIANNNKLLFDILKKLYSSLERIPFITNIKLIIDKIIAIYSDFLFI